MIFFLVMPGLFGGFGNYFVPIFQGSPEVVYPRVNNSHTAISEEQEDCKRRPPSNTHDSLMKVDRVLANHGPVHIALGKRKVAQ